MRKTELSARKRAVLAAIVKAYIESGEPIGSKILTELINNAPSSATLRNEMNELCALGLLCQPHTSAGRIPTNMGYKLYVNSLMQPNDVLDSTKNYIATFLSPATAQQQNLPNLAADALSSLTGFCAFSYFKIDSDTSVKDAEILPLSRKSAALLLVTSDGRAISRICNLKSNLSDELLERFNELIVTSLCKKRLNTFTRAALQNVVTECGIDFFELTPLLTELFDMAYTAAKSQFNLCGSMKLYNISTLDEIRALQTISENPEQFINVLEMLGRSDEVIFGSDTGIRALKGKVLVAKDYLLDGKPCGKIGVIGPERMFYEQIIPSIEYTANVLGAKLTSAQKDMED